MSMDLRISVLLDMGLSLEDAVASLNQANGVVEQAVELFFSGNVKPDTLRLKPAPEGATPLLTRGADSHKQPQSEWLGFGSNGSSQWNPSLGEDVDMGLSNPNDSIMAQRGLHSTSRSNIEGTLGDLALQVLPIAINPHDRVRHDSRPVGLHGLTVMTSLRCIIQALYHFPPVRRAIFEAGLFDSWGAVNDQYEVALDKTPACSLLMELEKLFSGQALSRRSFKSSLRVEEAFIAYRRLMNLNVPKEISETWAYFLHALGAEVHSLRRMTHIQVHQDEPTQTGESLTPCIDVDPQLNLYDSLDKVLGISPNPSVLRSYIFSRDEKISCGRIMSLIFRSPAENKFGIVTSRSRLYIDRYLGRHSELVCGLVRQRVAYARDLEQCRRQLAKFDQRELDFLKSTMEFLKNQPDLDASVVASNLNNVYQSMVRSITDLRNRVESLEYKVESAFDIPELQKMPFDLYAIFAVENSKTVVFLRNFPAELPAESEMEIPCETWTRFSDAETQVVPKEHISRVTCITALWYSYGVSYAEPIDENSGLVPAALKSLVHADNKALDVELEEWTKTHTALPVVSSPNDHSCQPTSPPLGTVESMLNNGG
ncbi:hypothetical protein BASA50_009117 [Batrachochytrium salamandrivorans]|uniref:UBA domain-containing protein n=1 Tax=Batrachochytrium salamandrivorans TaxID=1357716 RepID=A0ABQ8F2W0_9FUNG|nr:hypothetical protein BASA60_006306 [Batrachochytrium salamandrivorans]KAH6577816.1 hypothetical protein BASA62_000686 [Batrachochytrium salamandrivorans]KAH6578784.1 hypothetical protein BASA61_000013 [Batrachochytrium salamandrivorans]KAH6591115.1 hypothetical protein BASA50_009117 [Batrachochytrium salamandrivorans]KAH9277389.1 hypothetical protein BASA83_000259 [Batrachochytrium salamandrivorans]